MTELFWPTIAIAVVAGLGLLFAGTQVNRERKTREIELAENFLHDLQELNSEILEKYSTLDKEGKESLDIAFFNRLEWVCFLFNEKKIKDGKIKNFFEPAIKEWYEETFLKVMSQEYVDNPKSFYELKKFYNNIDKKKYQAKSKN